MKKNKTLKTLTIDGVEYNVDLDKAKKLGLITPTLVHSVGQLYKFENRLFLTSVVGVDRNGDAEVCLIIVTEGVRYVDAVPVKNSTNITPTEWYNITCGRPAEFVLVNLKISHF